MNSKAASNKNYRLRFDAHDIHTQELTATRVINIPGPGSFEVSFRIGRPTTGANIECYIYSGALSVVTDP